MKLDEGSVQMQMLEGPRVQSQGYTVSYVQTPPPVCRAVSAPVLSIPHAQAPAPHTPVSVSYIHGQLPHTQAPVTHGGDHAPHTQVPIRYLAGPSPQPHTPTPRGQEACSDAVDNGTLPPSWAALGQG